MFLQCFVALFMIKILPRVLNMDCKWPKLVQKYVCFILLRRDLNICGWETDEELTRFLQQFYGCFALQVVEPVT